MNNEQINKTFFDDLYQIQIDQIHASQLNQARKVILELVVHVDANDRDDIPGKDEAVLNALEWLKNNQL
tara:strand:+ start:558 stop:764 length:207 start_codon:yes stop_codon:yes gene_type:complete